MLARFPIDPRLASSDWASGSEAFHTQRFQKAVAHYRQVVSASPQDPQAHFALGASLGSNGQFDEAVSECLIASQLAPDWDLPFVEVGRIYLIAGRPRDALDMMESAQKRFSATPHLLHWLGTARLVCGDLVRAYGAYVHALVGQPMPIETRVSELQQKVSLQSADPLTIERAAYCAFGLKVLAMDRGSEEFARVLSDVGTWLAREADKRGVHNVYRLWLSGAFKGRVPASD